MRHPSWSRSAALYQINIRAFTPEGTFRAAEAHLPRLKDLGVDILWLMPIHPIGEQNRKGTLGSPYAVRDYYSVNPEFGTLADLQHFVQAAHALGLYVILDWVPNHTAWDCNLLAEHPDWYAHDWKGDLTPTPWWDWDDIIDLDYSVPALRAYMIDALTYWVREADIDGYRCDVAGFVPLDFWEEARAALDRVKPVFMLAEWENRDLHGMAFDATYAWTWYDTLHAICQGQADLTKLFVYYAWNEKAYPRDCFRMLFVSNHDKNAWDGTEYEQFGAGREAVIVLSVVSEGLPLIYNGQEAGNTRRLAFFDKDQIDWRDDQQGELYRSLLSLKKANTALHNGAWGARMVRVVNSAPKQVFSFVRQNERDKVFAVFNFSPAPQAVAFTHRLHHGAYIEYFTGAPMSFGPATHLSLEPWGCRLYVAEARSP